MKFDIVKSNGRNKNPTPLPEGLPVSSFKEERTKSPSAQIAGCFLRELP